MIFYVRATNSQSDVTRPRLKEARGGSNDQILEKEVYREGGVSADHKKPEVMSHEI